MFLINCFLIFGWLYNKIKECILLNKKNEQIRWKTSIVQEVYGGQESPFKYWLIEGGYKGLGSSIYKKDAETVSGSDVNKLLTVKNNFLIKKLGLADTEDLDIGINEVIKCIGVTERIKYRAVVYYLLVVRYNKASIYDL